METLKGLFIRVQEFAAEINKIKISTKKASEIKVLLDKLQTLKDECLVEISKGDHAITEPKLRGEFSELMGKLLHILTITKSDLWEEFHRKLDQATRQKDTPSSDDDGEDVPPEEKPPSTSKNTLPAHQESERVIIVEKDSERVASLENQTNERQIAPKNKPIVELKLDRLELPYFSGNLLEWIAFRDQFIDLAHNNSNLTTMIKFHLLRTHLKGAALETVAGYQFTASNYLAAWEDLLNRYDRTDSIIEEYIRRFVEIMVNFANLTSLVNKTSIDNYYYSFQLTRSLTHCGGTFSDLINLLNRIKHNSIKHTQVPRSGNPSRPWVSPKLLELIGERNRYAKLLKKNKLNQYLIAKHKTLSREIVRLKWKLRRSYNSNKMNRAASNPKRLWQCFNEIILNRRSELKTISCIHDRETGNNISDVLLIAEILNKFFCSIGRDLYNQIRPPARGASMATINRLTNSMFLTPVNESEVSHKIFSLKTTNSLKECINTSLLRENMAILSPKLVHLFNDNLGRGDFPSELKMARIVPIFKGGNPLNPSDYRPISIIPILAKIYEMLIHDRVNSFITKHNIIHKHQFGFLKNSGTLAAATTVINYIQKNLDRAPNTLIGTIFIDLKKAFDTVPHELLLAKLDNYGIRGIANTLIRNYITGRS